MSWRARPRTCVTRPPQGGFCSPGFMVKIYGELLNNEGAVSEHAIDNLCRCTGGPWCARALDVLLTAAGRAPTRIPPHSGRVPGCERAPPAGAAHAATGAARPRALRHVHV